MTVDLSQKLGTLVGLKNKLVLKNEETGQRLVLIPDGRISMEANLGHVRVMIDRASAQRVQAYDIDSLLCRLVDNGSLQSKLLLCYLHAVTSFCLPDPLTRMTGTEQALTILTSAAIRSFDQLTEENMRLLRLIAELTPGRSYYPHYEQVMESITWSSSIWFLSQHSDFYIIVKAIFNQAQKAHLFYPETQMKLPRLKDVDEWLLIRDRIRQATFRTSGFGAEAHTFQKDVTYKPRDRGQNTEGATKAFKISMYVYTGGKKLALSTLSKLQLWEFLHNLSHQIFGSEQPINLTDLSYNSTLLGERSFEFLSTRWCALHKALSRGIPGLDKFRVMMWLSTYAFCKNSNIEVLQFIASFFTLPLMASISPPSASPFNLSEGYSINSSEVRAIARSTLFKLGKSPENDLPYQPPESIASFRCRRERQFQRNRDLCVQRLSKHLESQGLTAFLNNPATALRKDLQKYMDVDSTMAQARVKFKHWHDNFNLLGYLDRISQLLEAQETQNMTAPSYPSLIPPWELFSGSSYISSSDIFTCCPPKFSAAPDNELKNKVTDTTKSIEDTHRLEAFIAHLKLQASSLFETKYVERLEESNESLKLCKIGLSLTVNGAELNEMLQAHHDQWKKYVGELYNLLESAVKKTGTHPWRAAFSAGQHPRLSSRFFLQQLNYRNWPRLSPAWKQCLIDYSVAITKFQRAQRLLSLFNSPSNLIRELQNSGHVNWNPAELPESLLLEAESGLLIRDVQENIAREMRITNRDRNITLQLNMGEGKSSLICPLVSSFLANGSRLVRVVVARPQSKQMQQMLVAKLGGLLDRKVYQLPFSRALRLTPADADVIGNICRECSKNGGVMLIQPEHILSFQLIGLEAAIAGDKALSQSLLSTQNFIDKTATDIIDEVDYQMNPRFELVYTMGSQKPMQLCPQRWTLIHHLLNLVREYAPKVKVEYPLSIEVHLACSGSFPKTRIIREDARNKLMSLIASRICKTGIDGFPIARQPASVRKQVYKYITESDISKEEIKNVESDEPGGFWAESTRNVLLLIRGLIAGGVLAFVLQKRWRVQYGPAGFRTPSTLLAVPYHAKDKPAQRSEFSHPDMVLMLTSISYYYAGLTDKELFMTFYHLLKSDQADLEFQAWVQDAPELADEFSQLTGINLKDETQCVQEVFPSLRFAKSLIDYYLSHLVFPKEIKEFPQKLSASGWDLGKRKTGYSLNGFSGTNDLQKVLPFDMEHLDLHEQKHTNALVLSYLLHPKNTVEILPASDDSTSNAQAILTMVVALQPSIQVVIDVGSLIIDLSNIDVARAWLKLSPPKSQAVVYFDDYDNLFVIDRRGRIESFLISPFAKQLDVCLVYLDESHCRGIDLRLPENSRAAVTLGPALVKDTLVQACMRMRQLDKGQSVVFICNDEIQRKILTRASKPDEAIIDVSDVLSWSIYETCQDLRRLTPLWAIEGKRFFHQKGLWSSAYQNVKLEMTREKAEMFLENASKSLEERYRPTKTSMAETILDPGRDENLLRIFRSCQEFDSLKFNHAELHEEQERELSPEIEQERQIERPKAMEPATHSIHIDLRTFIASGILQRNSVAFKSAFESLCDTSAAKSNTVSQFPKDLLVTMDFLRTVKIVNEKTFVSDSFHRSVQWILTSSTNTMESVGNSDHASTATCMLIISPYEANELLPEIKASKHVFLHLYAPRQNSELKPVDHLDLYTVPQPIRPLLIPRELVLQLNLFSGQLYLSSFDEYVEVCNLLGLTHEETKENEKVGADGFILGGDGSTNISTFTQSPVAFLKKFLCQVRRNGGGIEKTHLGKIVDGTLLLRSDFEMNERQGGAVSPDKLHRDF